MDFPSRDEVAIEETAEKWLGKQKKEGMGLVMGQMMPSNCCIFCGVYAIRLARMHYDKVAQLWE
jgi:hypothetical protein